MKDNNKEENMMINIRTSMCQTRWTNAIIGMWEQVNNSKDNK